MTFKRVNDFSVEKPDMLDRELSQLEDNVSAEFDLASKTYAKQMTVASFFSLGALNVVSLLPGEQTSVDTSQLSAIAVLPALVSDNFGRRFILIKRLGTNSIVVTCADPSVTYNGGAMPTITAIGVRVFYCDASGYYA